MQETSEQCLPSFDILRLTARWLTVAPKGQKDVEIILEKPRASMQGKAVAKKLMEHISQGTTWVFYTDNSTKNNKHCTPAGLNS